ncbi:TAXI family TRAP transporter solute-binding subunit [Ornithinimicrobium panacihumi]|uniref:TAXI family TRAP transporter solute-binding subunit n=1 Tax=Ornithinimicrobium panacihumi TaxID=2008449 RepID=UPI003F895949
MVGRPSQQSTRTKEFTMNKTLIALAAASALALTACGDNGGSSADTGGASGDQPSQLVMATYGTGTATYVDLAAVSEAITNASGTAIRIITSDTAIGRLSPLREGQADFARTGDEYIFAFEAEYDFATEDWGPQDMRVVWAPLAPHGLLVKDGSDIQTFEDLRGKKFPQITANPSVNNKLTAFLAYGGLTWDDVEVVEVGYSDQPDALKNGQIDVLFQQVYGASLFELESSTPVRWLSMDDEDQAKIDAVEEIAPSTQIGAFTDAPGQEDGEEAKGLMYAIPIVTYADKDPETVNYLVSQIVNNHDSYADATATSPGWAPDQAQTVPTQVPFHDGTVQLLEEEGLWTDEAEERNQALIERGEAMREGWEDFIAEADPENIAAEWAEWKDANLAE